MRQARERERDRQGEREREGKWQKTLNKFMQQAVVDSRGRGCGAD